MDGNQAVLPHALDDNRYYHRCFIACFPRETALGWGIPAIPTKLPMSEQTADTTTSQFFPTLDDLQRCGADDLLNDPVPAGAYHEAWSRLFAGRPMK